MPSPGRSSGPWASAPFPCADEQVAELSAEIAALRQEVASLARPAEAPSGSDERLAEIEARIDGLVMGRAEDSGLAVRLGELEEAHVADLDTVRMLAQAVETIRQEATAAPRVDGGEAADVTTALTQLAARIAALEEPQVSERDPGPTVPELISEVESVRLVLERISLHLGEHDRALADLSSTRGVHERLEELTAVVRSLEQSGQAEAPSQRPKDAPPVAGDVGALLQRVEEAEAAAQTEQREADEPPRADGLVDRLAPAATRVAPGGRRRVARPREKPAERMRPEGFEPSTSRSGGARSIP